MNTIIIWATPRPITTMWFHSARYATLHLIALKNGKRIVCVGMSSPPITPSSKRTGRAAVVNVAVCQIREGGAMAETKIEWCDFSWNPWVGCEKVSPACDYCYAESWAKRTGHPELWQGERRRTSVAYWRSPHRWNAAAIPSRRPRVFPSLCDPFDNQVPEHWRTDMWQLIRETSTLDWLLLTKRGPNIAKMLPADWGEQGYPNVWLGHTCADQGEFDRFYPMLHKVPAVVRFVSYEPALGPLSPPDPYDTPDWIIAGGESGSHARHAVEFPQWARDLRDDCEMLGIALFVKQMVRKEPIPNDLMVRKFPRPRA